nr:MAG TPA: hypothetical protein [Caudoviricetes sp.]DAM20341.1 MAG TPA: hypothetical protein [Caudoviricetes sp.]DAM97520.1 MAG TPA: hypothetical protein [Caudoviricetes sp.]DAR38226.1 MAG TPA: hypothetical protein [Caudoviricetes sp.]DAZ50840.1 MAG TPA: hypothetical protein [Caudoviricetes sp.]
MDRLTITRQPSQSLKKQFKRTGRSSDCPFPI